jgi:hypothetical protein
LMHDSSLSVRVSQQSATAFSIQLSDRSNLLG